MNKFLWPKDRADDEVPGGGQRLVAGQTTTSHWLLASIVLASIATLLSD